MPGYTPSHTLRYPLGTERPKAADIKNLADDTDAALAATRDAARVGSCYLRQSSAVAVSVNGGNPGYYALPLVMHRDNNSGVTMSSRAIIVPEGQWIVHAYVRWRGSEADGQRRLIISDITGTSLTTWYAFEPLPGTYLTEGLGYYGAVGEQQATAVFHAPAGGGRLFVGCSSTVVTEAWITSQHQQPGVHLQRIGEG